MLSVVQKLLLELLERRDVAGCPIAVLVVATVLTGSAQSPKRKKT